MQKKLTLGGGIVYLREQYDAGDYIDFGYSTGFNLVISSEVEFENKYLMDVLGNIIKSISTEGAITSFKVTGGFSNESMSRSLLQKLWFRGTDSTDGAELFASDLKPIVSGIKYLSVPSKGVALCLKLPSVHLMATKAVPIQDQSNWMNISFDFEVLFGEDFPSLRVQEEGEILPGFCT